MLKSLDALSVHSHKTKRDLLQDALIKNIDLIASLKERVSRIESENSNLSLDNEELRQFSLDGFEIAKGA